jgi:hypothetical protein
MLPTGSIPAQIHVIDLIAHFGSESKRYRTAKSLFQGSTGWKIIKIG